MTAENGHRIKNVTFRVEDGVIDEARRIAEMQGTSINAQFRLWLADFVKDKDSSTDTPDRARP